MQELDQRRDRGDDPNRLRFCNQNAYPLPFRHELKLSGSIPFSLPWVGEFNTGFAILGLPGDGLGEARSGPPAPVQAATTSDTAAARASTRLVIAPTSLRPRDEGDLVERRSRVLNDDRNVVDPLTEDEPA